MNNKIVNASIVAILFGSSLAFAATGKVVILSPANGVTVSSKDMIKLSYEADPGPGGDHLHLNVDGKRMDVIHKLKGVAEVSPLEPGKHQICLLVNTKGHVPIGEETCVDVISK